MEGPTYIVEASALNNGIHLLKQWVYENSASLLIPQCTFDAAEKAYKASLTPKEAQKDSAPGRSSGRTARKEQPLFDINPRTVWEFLLRAKSEKGEKGVKFQQENEEFTQWKEEEEKRVEEKVETPTAPTSFADALLRKLTIKEEKAQPKAPSKPRLVARNNEQKSPWKIQKVPTVSSEGIDETLKPLLSCVLWRLYEFENNPLQPERFIVLVSGSRTEAAMHKFGIPVTLFSTAHSIITKLNLENDHRQESGQLEAEFPEVLAMSHDLQYLHSEDEETGMPNGHVGPPEGEVKAEQSNDIQSGTIENLDSSVGKDTPVLAILKEILNEEPRDAKPAEDLPASNSPLGASELAKESSPKLQTSDSSDILKYSLDKPEKTAESGIKSNGYILQDKPSQELTENQKPPKLALRNGKSKVQPDPDSDIGSDEEIIVFNPKARRASGLPKKNKDRSRPTTSNGPSQRPLKIISKESTTARPATSSGPTATDGSVVPVPLPMVNGHHSSKSLGSVDDGMATSPGQAKIKPYAGSKLKAESAIFVPGQPFIPSQAALPREPTPPVPSEVSPQPSPSPVLPTQPRNPTPRHPRGTLQHRNPSQEQLRLQRESQRIIQRQREAIQRHTKATEEKPKSEEKPPPRQIKLEPTDNPTIIDPDAFDRSYVVQAPSSSPSTNSSAEKRRSRGHHARGNHSKGSPKRSVKTSGNVEADVDYVLKSGATRASVRGKGKLWVP